MTLKEEILKNSRQTSENIFENELFFSKLAKGFVADYKVFGEDTTKLYEDVFGEEFSPIFESFEENINVLEEATNKDKTNLLFEQSQTHLGKELENKLLKYTTGGAFKEPDKKPGIERTLDELGKKASEFSKDASKKASEVSMDIKKAANSAAFKGRSFLFNIGEKIRQFGHGLSEKFPKVADFLQKGFSWIIANPLIVAGAAGGTLLLGKLISVLKKNGQTKKAEKLQKALDTVKDKSTEKPAEKKAASVDTEKKCK